MTLNANDCGAPGKATAHCFEHDKVILLDPPIAHRKIKR